MKYILSFGILWWFFVYIGIPNNVGAIIAALLMFASVCASVWQKHQASMVISAAYKRLKIEDNDKFND